MNNGVQPEVPKKSSTVKPWGGWFMTHVCIFDWKPLFPGLLQAPGELPANRPTRSSTPVKLGRLLIHSVSYWFKGQLREIKSWKCLHSTKCSKILFIYLLPFVTHHEGLTVSQHVTDFTACSIVCHIAGKHDFGTVRKCCSSLVHVCRMCSWTLLQNN